VIQWADLSPQGVPDEQSDPSPLYGHQEGALKGDNPHKPERSSHTCPTDCIAGLRLIPGVERRAGNQTASEHSAPSLREWELLARLPRAHRPPCIRGNRDRGTQANMARAEPAGIPDRVKLRMIAKVKQAVARRMRDAARGRHGAETTLRPSGRSRARRAVVLRRSVKADLAVVEQGVPEQLRLSFAALTDRTILYEDAVPATALPREFPSVAQLDRDPLRNAAPNCGAAEPPATPVPDALAYADEVSQRPPLAAARRAAGIGLAVELAAICTPPRAGNGPRWASTALSRVMPHHPTHPP
jgi:hypothetical protein